MSPWRKSLYMFYSVKSVLSLLISSEILINWNAVSHSVLRKETTLENIENNE